jgi:hypothetical protein
MDQKIVLLHGFSRDEVLAAMRALKEAVPAFGDAAFATTTPTNMDWKLGDLIGHIGEEHSQFLDSRGKKTGG